MALPKLNSNPKYELTIPSSGRKVRFRPFLVKEEKALMIAIEAGGEKDALNALVDTIVACTDEDLNTKKLTSFDIEYIFLQLRAKSVGETANIGVKCSECGHSNSVSVRLDDIKIEIPDINKNIQLDENISIDVDWPTFHDLTEIDLNNPSSETAFNLIGKCITAIISPDERISVNDVTQEELKDFIEQMNTAQFTKLKEFVEIIPKLKHKIEFDCKKCAHSNNVTVEGVESFLS